MNQQPQTGKKIENYVFNYADFLGSGNFSKCYKATNIVTKDVVAIKIVELNSLKSKKLEELLFSEIAVLKELNHPNVLRCLEVFTSNRNCYIVTELCDEGDLQGKIKKGGSLSEEEMQKVIADVYGGLYYLSSKGIVHRDLKIANIFMKDGKAKIADFGFAVHSTTNFKDLNIGSPLYMSPQGFLTNMYGPKTDVWSFGIMVYELYHNRTPFSRCMTEKDLKASIMTPISYNQLKTNIPTEAKELILNCLQISQEKRPLMKDLQNSAYLSQALRNRNNNSPKTPLQLQSPPKLLQTGPMTDSRPMGVAKTNRMQSVMLSDDRSRTVNRYNSPQKVMTTTFSNAPTHGVMNASVNQPNRAQSTQKNSTHSSFNFNFQSPQLKRNNVPSKQGFQSVHASIETPQIKPRMTVESPLNKPPSLSTPQPSKRPCLIECQLNFKESVGVLHYCRLLFKYLDIYKVVTSCRQYGQKKHYSVLGKFLMNVLEQMNQEIQKKNIKYDGENSEVRQKKLNEVTNEYLKKYSKQLDQNIIKVHLTEDEKQHLSLKKLKENVQMEISSRMINQHCSNQEAIAGELLLVIFSSTVLLEVSKNRKSFSLFQKNKDIEDILNKNKNNFTFSSYKSLKNKVFNNRTA